MDKIIICISNSELHLADQEHRQSENEIQNDNLVTEYLNLLDVYMFLTFSSDAIDQVKYDFIRNRIIEIRKLLQMDKLSI